MTACVRRWTRRRQPHNLSCRLAAVRRYRGKNLGPLEIDLLGKDWFRKMVALALLLTVWNRKTKDRVAGLERPGNCHKSRIPKSLHNISYQTLCYSGSLSLPPSIDLSEGKTGRSVKRLLRSRCGRCFRFQLCDLYDQRRAGVVLDVFLIGCERGAGVFQFFRATGLS